MHRWASLAQLHMTNFRVGHVPLNGCVIRQRPLTHPVPSFRTFLNLRPSFRPLLHGPYLPTSLPPSLIRVTTNRFTLFLTTTLPLSHLGSHSHTFPGLTSPRHTRIQDLQLQPPRPPSSAQVITPDNNFLRTCTMSLFGSSRRGRQANSRYSHK